MDWIDSFVNSSFVGCIEEGPVAQLAEAADLRSEGCEFESHGGHLERILA